MNDEEIMASFVEFQSSIDGSLDFNLSDPQVNKLILSFVLDRYMVKINFSKMTIESNSDNQNLQSWLRTSRNYIRNNDFKIQKKQISLNDLFQTLVDNYDQIISGHQNPQKRVPDSPAPQADYAVNQVYPYDLPQLSPVHNFELLAFIANEHFIFTQAYEAKALIDQLVAKIPEIRYSLDIAPNPQAFNTRIEIDPSFLDISDRDMEMLGLTFEHPITIAVSVDRIRLGANQEYNRWTKECISMLSFEVFQNNNQNSYGCPVYIKDLIKTFTEDTIARASNTLKAQNLNLLAGMGYEQTAVNNALTTANDDIDLAIEVLNYGSIRPFKGNVKINLMKTNNFWYNLVFFLRDRLDNCTNYCLQCCRRHKYDSIKLVSCANDFCEHRYEQVAGFSVLAELKNKFVETHLEISFAAKALFCGRAMNVFEPFPSFMLKDRQVRGRAGFLDAQKVKYDRSMDANKNIDGVKDLFNRMPHPDTILKSCYDEASLRAYLADLSANPKNDNIYQFIRYILATNHIAILPLTNNTKIQGLPNECKQFIIATNSPETEAYFSREKARYGSFFAFHGSAIENWYSILRNGIRNLSNTHLMTAGAAYGVGVYAAENMSTSLGYSKNSIDIGWQHSMLCNPPTKCMAIIEIINKPEYIKSAKNIYVMSNDRDLIIRYLLIFPATIVNCNVAASNLQLEQHFTQSSQNFKNGIAEAKQARIQAAVNRAKMRVDPNKIQQEEHKNVLLRDQIIQNQYQYQYQPQLINPYVELDQNLFLQNPEKLPFHEEVKNEIPEYLMKHIRNEIVARAYNPFTPTHVLINALERRHQIEFNNLLANDQFSVSRIEFENELSTYVWHVSVNAFSFVFCEDLQQDFERYQQMTGRPQCIVFEVRIEYFPKEHPFIRVLSPRLNSMGFITPEGSVCMENLSLKSWVRDTSIVGILSNLIYNLNNKIRIDFQNLNKPYSLRDAITDFYKNARSMKYI